MKTSININESDLDKMKRESLEWIDRYGKTAPPFISVAINAFSQLPAPDIKIEKEENEQKVIRISKVFYFVVMHKTDCYRAFKLNTKHEGYKSPEGQKLIELARQEIGYSDKTWSGDIYSSIYNTYKSIVVDGVDVPEQCHKIYDKVIGAWIPENRSFEEMEQIKKDLSGEKIEDVKTFTSTDYPEQIPDLGCGIYGEKELLPYPNPVSRHQTDINIGWARAMKYMGDRPVKDTIDEELIRKGLSALKVLSVMLNKTKLEAGEGVALSIIEEFENRLKQPKRHPVKEITDEEIESEANKIISPLRVPPFTSAYLIGWIEGAKWMRNEMNS
jgi:hypothetical protein